MKIFVTINSQNAEDFANNNDAFSLDVFPKPIFTKYLKNQH